MTIAKTAADTDPPFGPAVVKRGLQIEYQVMEQDLVTGAITPKDISAARYTYRVRTWSSDDDADIIHDELVAKGATPASGELNSYFACGSTVRDTLVWEIVEIDNDNDDANTRTTKRERILERWHQPIIDAP